jgi:hypothetical protein
MLAIRLSTTIGPSGSRGSRVEEAEARILKAWERLTPELCDYALAGFER